jgi:Gluconate 2-dehydrogenase subunit 3
MSPVAHTVGGVEVLLSARDARAQNAPFRLLKPDEAETIEALGETLVPGARAAGIAYFIDQQLSVPPQEALLEARILNVRPPYANFYRAALGAVDNASQSLNGSRKFAQLSPAEQHDFVDAMRQNKIQGWQVLVGRSSTSCCAAMPSTSSTERWKATKPSAFLTCRISRLRRGGDHGDK